MVDTPGPYDKRTMKVAMEVKRGLTRNWMKYRYIDIPRSLIGQYIQLTTYNCLSRICLCLKADLLYSSACQSHMSCYNAECVDIAGS